MYILGLGLICLFMGLSMVYTGLFKWPDKKPLDCNIIDAEWEEINEREDNKFDVFI